MASRVETFVTSGQEETVILASAEVLMERAKEIHELIERRAYEIFEQRGRAHGSHLSDWLRAESELLFPCRHELKDVRDALVLKAEMPGNFTAAELELSVEPHRLIVSGERKVEAIIGSPAEIRFKTIPQRIFRAHELPIEIDPSRTIATLRGSVLEVVMPKMVRE
jgi:HSP20 family molecular chaperone IbpA